MKIDVEIELNEDFDTLCSIYEIPPAYLIQRFVDKLSLPNFYTNSDPEDRWAVMFFLQTLDSEDFPNTFCHELQDRYLTLFTQVIKDLLEKDPFRTERAEEAGRRIMRRWRADAMSHRSKYLTDDM